MNVLNEYPSVGPYMGISHQTKRAIKGLGTFRILISGAFNAGGLIGPERNGIVVLDENRMQIVCDRMCQQTSGYSGPSTEQITLFEHLSSCDAPTFQETINSHPRTRYKI